MTATRSQSLADEMLAVNLARNGLTVDQIVPARYHDAGSNDLKGPLAEWNGSSSLYLHGPVGTGKTHQAAALVLTYWNRFITSEPYNSHGYIGTRDVLSIYWASVPRLLEDIRHSFNVPDMAPDVHGKALLVLDDLGAEKPSEWVEERLYCIVNDRYENELPLIATSNLSLTQLAQRIGARTASRLREMCDAYKLDGSDRRNA
jgi:DNA replication protein DnaC